MNLQKLDKFSLANIIANVINFHIAKHNLFESSFIKVINIINEYKQNNKNENRILRIIIYVINALKLSINELEKQEIIENIINDIKFNYPMSMSLI
jgi:hypothetical protein